jgi:hypothetical protein
MSGFASISNPACRRLAGSGRSASKTIRWKSGHITPDPTKLSAFFILGGIPMVVTGRKHSV